MSKIKTIKCVDILHSILLRGICIVDRSSNLKMPLGGGQKAQEHLFMQRNHLKLFWERIYR